MQHDHTSNSSMAACIDTCTNCRAVCIQTVNHCLTKGGKHADAKHIRALLDCADMCDVAARFMLRESSSHAEVCRACAAVCNACASSCEAMADDDDMKRCAEVCRECAKSCEKMAA